MLGFFYDMTKCVGCKACQMACKEMHHLPVGDFYRRVETIRTDAFGPVFFPGPATIVPTPPVSKPVPPVLCSLQKTAPFSIGMTFVSAAAAVSISAPMGHRR